MSKRTPPPLSEQIARRADELAAEGKTEAADVLRELLQAKATIQTDTPVSQRMVIPLEEATVKQVVDRILSVLMQWDGQRRPHPSYEEAQAVFEGIREFYLETKRVRKPAAR